MSKTYFPKTIYGRLQKVYCAMEAMPVLGWPLQRMRPAIEKWLLWNTRPERRQSWIKHVELTKSSEDNKYIPRVADAGKVKDGCLILHNGIRVWESSYAGEGMRMLMKENKGVHEPQEERYFQEVLKTLPEAPTMLELGAWWGFYSLWLQQVRPASRCCLVEPNASNMMYGKKNFALNNAKGEFLQAFIDRQAGGRVEGVPVVSVDALMEKFNLEHLSILHADIQGYELPMLEGAQKTLSLQKADYVFISTHGDQLHKQCEEILKSHNYILAVSITPEQSFLLDGILVACSPKVTNAPKMELSINRSTIVPVTL